MSVCQEVTSWQGFLGEGCFSCSQSVKGHSSMNLPHPPLCPGWMDTIFPPPQPTAGTFPRQSPLH